MYVPTMIFGHLLTSSNYDDSQKKVTGTELISYMQDFFFYSLVVFYLFIKIDAVQQQFFVNYVFEQVVEMGMEQSCATFSVQSSSWKLLVRSTTKPSNR